MWKVLLVSWLVATRIPFTTETLNYDLNFRKI